MQETTRTFRPGVKAYFLLCGTLSQLPVYSLIIAIMKDDPAFYWIAAVTFAVVLIAFATLFRYRIIVEESTIERRGLWSGCKKIDRDQIARVDCIREQTSRGRPMLLNVYAIERPKKLAMGIGLTTFRDADREEIAYLIRATPVQTN